MTLGYFRADRTLRPAGTSGHANQPDGRAGGLRAMADFRVAITLLGIGLAGIACGGDATTGARARRVR